MKHTITVYKGATSWLARFSDPTILEEMGTDTIPTAYTLKCPAETVLARLQAMNPDDTVVLGV